jgi:hypothetical protein
MATVKVPKTTAALEMRKVTRSAEIVVQGPRGIESAN